MNVKIKEEKLSKNKTLIGIPSPGLIHAETLTSTFAAAVNIPGQVSIMAPTGCYVHQLREFICMSALQQEATHVMFIDSDMVFPPDAIKRLMLANKLIIGADYNYKIPEKLSVTKLDPEKVSAEFIEDDPRFPGTKKFGIKRPNKPIIVKAVGTGFMLINTKALKKIPKPWFWFDIEDEKLVGEDVYFCRKAAEYGINVWCDPTIPVGHIGNYIY